MEEARKIRSAAEGAARRSSSSREAAKQQLVVVIGSDATTLKSFPYNDSYIFYI